MLKNKDQSGFIPLLIICFLIIAAVIYLAFKYVAQNQK